MANNARVTGKATIIDRRRFLKQTALTTAMVSVPYLAGKTVAFGKENAEGTDAALDRALEELVAMDGGPPCVIAIVQRGSHWEIHSFGVRNPKGAKARGGSRRVRRTSRKIGHLPGRTLSSPFPPARSLTQGSS